MFRSEKGLEYAEAALLFMACCGAGRQAPEAVGLVSHIKQQHTSPGTPLSFCFLPPRVENNSS